MSSRRFSVLKRILTQAVIVLCCVVLLQPPAVQAQSESDTTPNPDIPQCRLENMKLNYDDIENDWWDPCGNNICSNAGSSSNLGNVKVTGENVRDAFNYFVQQFGTLPSISPDLAKIYAAAVVGNFYHESAGVNPTINQTGGGPGRGIAQWSVNERWQGVIKLAADLRKNGGSASEWDLAVQLQFAWKEITEDWGGSRTDLLKQTTLDAATVSFSSKYERPNPAKAQNEKRIGYANDIIKQFGDGVNVGGGTSSGGANCSGSGTVNCNQPNNASLSPVRQNVVCLAQQELQLWDSGQLKPGNGYFKYSENIVQDWCADFASWIYNQAGKPVNPPPAWRVAAVAGIRTIGQSNRNGFQWRPAGNYTPRPGDLAIHDIGASHVNIVTQVNGNTITLIGGNQGSGPYPSGSRVSQDTNIKDVSGYVVPD